MNAQIMNMAIVMGSMQITNRLDLEDTKTKQIILAAYVTAQAVVIGVSFLIQRRITAKKDTTVLKYLDQPKPMSGEQPKLVTTTNMDYDLEQNAQAQKQALIGLALMVFLHFQFGVIRPLIVQSILPVKNALQSKFAQVHLFGKAAEGDLKRPWKADNPFAALTGGAEEPQSEAAEKAAIKKAEKAESKAGSKSESKKDL
ncbi:MAG: putative phosphate transporter [Linnemannia gamsii]|nr:MAG: putative phosphate transporter [Linnemannia gamsii]